MSVNSGEAVSLLQKPPVDHSNSAWFIIILNIGLNFALYGFQNIFSTYFIYLNVSQNLSGVLTNVFTSVAYLFALVGGFMADTYTGLFATIILGSVLMFLSLTVLAVMNALDVVYDLTGALYGVSFVCVAFFVIGSGFTKSCVSAFVGDQFNSGQDAKRTQFYSWYYLSIQFGSIVISVASPIIFALKPWGSWGIFVMLSGALLITVPVFVAARRKFHRRSPKGSVYSTVVRIIQSAFRNRRSPHLHWLDPAKLDFSEQEVEDVKTALRVVSIFLPLPFFWAIFFQMYSVWVFQASAMNRYVFGWLVPAPVTITLNPLFDIFIIPIFASGLYPLLKRCGLNPTPLRKIAAGHVFTVAALVVSGFVELAIQNAPYLHIQAPVGANATALATTLLVTPTPLNDPVMKDVSIWWIVPQYFLVSVAEILLSVTVYEFAYSQAPASMKGLLSGLLMITIAIGNALLAILQLINGSRAIMDFAYAGAIVVVLGVFLLIARSYVYTKPVEEEVAQ